MQPDFGQARAKLPCETGDCCLRARFGSCSGFLSPPAPRGAGGPGHSFCVPLRLFPLPFKAGSSPAFCFSEGRMSEGTRGSNEAGSRDAKESGADIAVGIRI